MKMAAIRSGSEPNGPLPAAAFHRWLEDPIVCPRCSVLYNIVVDGDAAAGRFFEREAAPLIRLLMKAVRMGHADGHRTTHFETAGVVVVDVMAEAAGT